MDCLIRNGNRALDAGQGQKGLAGGGQLAAAGRIEMTNLAGPTGLAGELFGDFGRADGGEKQQDDKQQREHAILPENKFQSDPGPNLEVETGWLLETR
jgi:hypothetical protein